MKRACIVGLHNRVSNRDEDALEPYTPNGSGERLWKMINAVCGCTKEQYLEAFSLLNLRVGTPPLVQLMAKEVREIVGSQPAAVLGAEAWMLLGLEKDKTMRRTDWFENRDNWYLLPHPSGLCRVYNSKEMKLRAGELLCDIGGLR